MSPLKRDFKAEECSCQLVSSKTFWGQIIWMWSLEGWFEGLSRLLMSHVNFATLKLEKEVILLLRLLQSRTPCSTGMISAEPISGCCAVIMQMKQADWLFWEQNKTHAALKGDKHEDERDSESEGEKKRRITKAEDEKPQVSVSCLFLKSPLLMQVIYQMANLAEPKWKNRANICAVRNSDAKTNKWKEKKEKEKRQEWDEWWIWMWE